MKTPLITKSKSRQTTNLQEKLAAKIFNDITEGIDCGESRQALRMAVAYFAGMAVSEAQRRATLDSRIEMFRCAKALMDSVLPPTL